MSRLASVLTYADCVEMLIAFAMGHGRDADMGSICQAIVEAQDEIGQIHRWTFLERHGRVVIQARQTTGTIAYDHTGGSSERLCTLTGATNPSWIDDATLRIGTNDIVCEVEDGTAGATTFTLSERLNPGQDVAAGSSYVLYPRYSWLPVDFGRMATPMNEDDWNFGEKKTLSELLAKDRYDNVSDTEVRYYAIAEVPDVFDRLALFTWPQMTSLKTIDFAYQRRQRPLRYSGYNTDVDHAGTIAVTADSASVTGTSTAFELDMVNAIFRIGTHAVHAPTGKGGKYPWAEERAIAAFSSASGSGCITLDAGVVTTRSGVKCRVTDPIDVGRVARNAFLACCRRNLAQLVSLDKGDSDGSDVLRQAQRAYDRALVLAMGADNADYADVLRDGASLGGKNYTLDRSGWG